MANENDNVDDIPPFNGQEIDTAFWGNLPEARGKDPSEPGADQKVHPTAYAIIERLVNKYGNTRQLASDRVDNAIASYADSPSWSFDQIAEDLGVQSVGHDGDVRIEDALTAAGIPVYR